MSVGSILSIIFVFTWMLVLVGVVSYQLGRHSREMEVCSWRKSSMEAQTKMAECSAKLTKLADLIIEAEKLSKRDEI